MFVSGNYTRRALCSDLVQEVALTHSSGQGHRKASNDDCTVQASDVQPTRLKTWLQERWSVWIGINTVSFH